MRLPVCITVSLTATACTGGSASHGPIHITVGVPFPVENALFPDTLYPILLTTPAGTRPLQGSFVATPTSLRLFADSLLLTFAFDSTGTEIGILRYRFKTSDLDTLPRPPGFSPILSTLDFSPDARYMAYFTFPGNGTGCGVVRRLPTGALVLQTSTVNVPETDARIGYAEWADSLTFVLWVRAEGLPPDHWLRFRGQVTGSAVVTDTVEIETPKPNPSP
jgi:hypothetical protein